MSKIMSAVSGISDKHITEFADLTSGRKPVFRLSKILTIAACILVIAAIALPVGISIIGRSGENTTLYPTVFPYVIINGTMFYYDASFHDLPDGYTVIGKVSSVDPADKGKDGFSVGCKIGDLIFQNPEKTDEIYVYTRLFSGDKYHFIRFVKL